MLCDINDIKSNIILFIYIPEKQTLTKTDIDTTPAGCDIKFNIIILL